jgi:ubiquitin carboxyl-terminal hydrolase 7
MLAVLLADGGFQDTYDVLVTKSGVIEDLIEALVKKAKIPGEEEGGKMHVYEASNHKFFRELDRTYPVISINDYAQVIAERIPEEELKAAEEDIKGLVSVFHFQQETSRPHGLPFRLLVIQVSDPPGVDSRRVVLIAVAG